MPTIEEKIEASKAIEAELVAELLALPGAEVTNQNGENLLHAINRQRDVTWQLGRWLPETAFGGVLSGAQQPQQAQQGLIGPDAYKQLAVTYTVEPAPEPAPEPEPPTLVATEPPAPEAPAAEPV